MWCGAREFSDLVTKSRLALLSAEQVNELEMMRSGSDSTLFGKPAYRQADRLISQNNHIVSVWMLDSFIKPETEVVRN